MHRNTLLLLLTFLDAPLFCAADPATQKVTGQASIIIAPKAFHPALTGFAEYKRKDRATKLVALEEILKTSNGADDPEKLKRFLFQEWRQAKLGFVLLVGDVDVMPVRYMVLDRATTAAFDYAFYPSDLYYADLAKADGSFDDWNGNKEGFHAGYFGEVRGEKNKKDPINFDGVDYRPELAVGRWPVNTKEQVKLVADKSLRYEQGLKDGKKPGAQHAAFIHVGGWVDMRGWMDKQAGKLSQGWHTEKRFFGRTPPPTEVELVQLLNAGQGLVVHAGHGDSNCWEQCFFLPTLAKLKNADRLPVILSAGCSTAYFAPLPPYQGYTDIDGKEHKGTDHGEVFKEPPPPPSPYQKGKHNLTSGLGEMVLRAGPNGAVAYIGCNTGSQPCGLTLVEGFVDALAKSPDPRLGTCWAEAIRQYYDNERLAHLKPNSDWYPPSIFFQGMKFMLFGDPTLPLPKPQKLKS
jgi:hypothetical protein